MAWQVVGMSNEDMCWKLKSAGILSNGEIFNAFRAVDRGEFAFVNMRHHQTAVRRLAYADRPYRRQHLHISAPHIYVQALNALVVLNKHNQGLSFLNIGSGSGYFTCIVAFLLGKHGLCHGVELYDALTQHAADMTKQWLMLLHKRQQYKTARNRNEVEEMREYTSTTLFEESDLDRPVEECILPNRIPPLKGAPIPDPDHPASTNCKSWRVRTVGSISYMTGNCFQLYSDQRYDRLYVGAAVPATTVEGEVAPCTAFDPTSFQTTAGGESVPVWYTFLPFINRKNGVMVLTIGDNLTKVQMCGEMEERLLTEVKRTAKQRHIQSIRPASYWQRFEAYMAKLRGRKVPSLPPGSIFMTEYRGVRYCYTLTVLQSVRFNELLFATEASQPRRFTEVPGVNLPRMPMWTLKSHSMFPLAFRQVVRSLALGRCDPVLVGPPGSQRKFKYELPFYVWLYVISFLGRDWFCSMPVCYQGECTIQCSEGNKPTACDEFASIPPDTDSEESTSAATNTMLPSEEDLTPAEAESKSVSMRMRHSARRCIGRLGRALSRTYHLLELGSGNQESPTAAGSEEMNEVGLSSAGNSSFQTNPSRSATMSSDSHLGSFHRLFAPMAGAALGATSITMSDLRSRTSGLNKVSSSTHDHVGFTEGTLTGFISLVSKRNRSSSQESTSSESSTSVVSTSSDGTNGPVSSDAQQTLGGEHSRAFHQSPPEFISLRIF